MSDFNAGELVASIRLDGLPRFEQDNRAAEATFRRTGAAADAAGAKAAAALRGAAVATSAVTVATGAYLTSLFKTGAAYNTLQQTSRAALSTLLGGAKAANAQMDKLDAFAKNSPFSKAVFISAQQQLLGFGVEAKKVIPYLSAIQDAVAATGGSSQQLSDVTFVLAQIQAAGKITGQDLLQLGQRGINAADLIGSQMGKTGAQIKKSITKGSLDATTALDALTKGMAEKFGGAAAGVKATWDGTKDRIKAANREIGATLAEPFISQRGGGLAIQWGNQVADVMRAILTQTGPVVSILEGRAAPAFALITETLDRARVIVKSWDSNRLEQFLDRLSDYGPAVAAVTGALVGLTSQGLRGMLGPLQGLVPALGPVPGMLAAIALTSPEVRDSLGDLLAVFEPLIPVGEELVQMLASGLNMVLPAVAAGIDGVATVATPLVQVLADMPTPVLAGVAAFIALRTAAGPLAPMLEAGTTKLVAFTAAAKDVVQGARMTAYLRSMEGGASRFSTFMGMAGGAVRGFGTALKEVFVANAPALVILGVVTAGAALASVFAAQAKKAAEANKRVAEYRDTLTETGQATVDTYTAIAKALEAQTGEADYWDDNAKSLKKLTEEAGGAQEIFIDLGTSLDEAAKAAADGGSVYDSMILKLQQLADAGNAENQQWAWNRDDAVVDQGRAAQALIGYLKGAHEEAARAAQTQQELAAKTRAAAAQMTDMARSNDRMNAALEIARDVTKDATERLSALKQALDELNGGTKSQADLTQDLNDQARSLADAFSATDDKGKKLAKSLVDNAGQINTTTAAGSALRDQVQGLNDEMLTAIQVADKEAKARGESGISMQKAAEVAQPYIDKLRTIATESGLSKDKVDALVRAQLDSPDTVAFALTDNGTVDAEQMRLFALAQQIKETPDGSFEIESKDVGRLQTALAKLGIDIESLPDGTIKVKKDNGSFESVRAALQQLVENRTVRINATTTRANAGNTQGKAAGGRIVGAGTGTSDSIAAWLSNGEHVVTAREVQAAGGHAAVERWRSSLLSTSAPKYANGGAVGALMRYASGGKVDVSAFRDMLEEWARAQRRGENKAAGLSGNGLSLVDKLFDIADQSSKSKAKKLDAIALKSEKAFLKLEKQADTAATRLEAAKQKLSDLKDAAAQMASSVATAVRGLFKVSDLATENRTTTTNGVTVSGVSAAGPTASGIASSMAATAGRIKAFADKLSQLAKKGLSPALLAEIASLGVENGEPIVDALLTATAGEISSINSSYAAIDAGSNAAGATVSDANFKALISQAEKDQAAAQKNADNIRAQLTKETDRIIKAITSALKSGAKKAGGGPIIGPGSGLSDSVPIMASNGEHMWTAREVVAAGGHSNVQRMRQAILSGSFHATGGPVGRTTAYRVSVPSTVSSTASGAADVDLDSLADRIVGALYARPPITYVNPIVKNLEQEAWEQAQITGGPRV